MLSLDLRGIPTERARGTLGENLTGLDDAELSRLIIMDVKHDEPKLVTTKNIEQLRGAHEAQLVEENERERQALLEEGFDVESDD